MIPHRFWKIGCLLGLLLWPTMAFAQSATFMDVYNRFNELYQKIDHKALIYGMVHKQKDARMTPAPCMF